MSLFCIFCRRKSRYADNGGESPRIFYFKDRKHGASGFQHANRMPQAPQFTMDHQLPNLRMTPQVSPSSTAQQNEKHRSNVDGRPQISPKSLNDISLHTGSALPAHPAYIPRERLERERFARGGRSSSVRSNASTSVPTSPPQPKYHPPDELAEQMYINAIKDGQMATERPAAAQLVPHNEQAAARFEAVMASRLVPSREAQGRTLSGQTLTSLNQPDYIHNMPPMPASHPHHLSSSKSEANSPPYTSNDRTRSGSFHNFKQQQEPSPSIASYQPSPPLSQNPTGYSPHLSPTSTIADVLLQPAPRRKMSKNIPARIATDGRLPMEQWQEQHGEGEISGPLAFPEMVINPGSGESYGSLRSGLSSEHEDDRIIEHTVDGIRYRQRMVDVPMNSGKSILYG